MDSTIPAQLRFPPPPWRWATAGRKQVAAYVGAILRWRDALEHALRHERASLPQDLSDRSVELMLAVLARADQEPAPGSLYSVRPFPASVEPTRESLLELMRWRAGFSDYLADVWDVIGTPAYDVYECKSIGEFLRPLDADLRCCSCLDRFASWRRHAVAHRCSMFAHVTSRWPGGPYGGGQGAQ